MATDLRTLLTPERFHAQHSASLRDVDPSACWYCGRERARCRRKIWHASEQSAVLAAGELIRSGRTRAGAYKCPWCDGFHVTTTRLTDTQETDR